MQNKRTTFSRKRYFDKENQVVPRMILIKADQENDCSSTDKIERKNAYYTCSCGVRILIVPDLATMNKAIKNHVIEHKRLTGLTLRYDFLVEKTKET
jgi:hypothetical protein